MATGKWPFLQCTPPPSLEIGRTKTIYPEPLYASLCFSLYLDDFFSLFLLFSHQVNPAGNIALIRLQIGLQLLPVTTHRYNTYTIQ
jgi:hypothetical protein